MIERKRLIKLARKVDPTRLMEFVNPQEGDLTGHFLVGSEKDGYLLCCWNGMHGLMTTMIDDGVLGFALEQHLLAIGRVFGTEREAEDFAISNGWPGRRRYQ